MSEPFNSLIINSEQVNSICSKLAQQILELYKTHPNLKIVAVQPRGILFAESLKTVLKEEYNFQMDYGKIDPSFYRDDISSHRKMILPTESIIQFEVENQPILLIDDVLYTGRTTRAAIEALLDLGRPKWVKLMVLINRYLERQLPISADFEGFRIEANSGQKISVALNTTGELEININNG